MVNGALIERSELHSSLLKDGSITSWNQRLHGAGRKANASYGGWREKTLHLGAFVRGKNRCSGSSIRVLSAYENITASPWLFHRLDWKR